MVKYFMSKLCFRSLVARDKKFLPYHALTSVTSGLSYTTDLHCSSLYNIKMFLYVAFRIVVWWLMVVGSD